MSSYGDTADTISTELHDELAKQVARVKELENHCTYLTSPSHIVTVYNKNKGCWDKWSLNVLAETYYEACNAIQSIGKERDNLKIDITRLHSELKIQTESLRHTQESLDKGVVDYFDKEVLPKLQAYSVEKAFRDLYKL